MAALTSYSTGTISIGAGATSVVGVGSIWTGGNVFAGDTLVVAGHEVTVLEVVDATHLTIEAWPYSAVTAGSSYKIYKTSSLRVTNAQIATQTASIFAALASDGYFYFIDTTETVPDPSLGDDGQYALKPSTGEVWLKTGGVWVSQGIYKAFSIKGAWSGATAYIYGDVVSSSGSSYVCISAHTNHVPPNAIYWALLASVGATGATGPTGPTGAGYGGTSTTSLLIAIASKVFTTQAGLAYQIGNYVRASSAANGANYMEGYVLSYSSTTLTINVTKIGGSGTLADWNFSISGAPGAGTPGGSTTQVQYNNTGGFAGISGATSDGTNLFVTTQSSKDNSTKAASTAYVDATAREKLSANRKYFAATTGNDSNTGMLTGTATITFTNGSTNVGWTAHGKSVGDVFYPTTSGALPTNFTASKLYYIKTVVDANNVTVSATSGGSAISAGSAGSGTHTANSVSPFLTLQRPMNVISTLDCGTNSVEVFVADGTYAAGLVLTTYLGSGSVTFTGNTTTPASCSTDKISTGAFGGNFICCGFKVAASFGQDIVCGTPTQLTLSDMEYGGATNYNIYATFYGKLTLQGANHKVSGAGLYGLFLCEIHGTLYLNNATITFLSNKSYSIGTITSRQVGYSECSGTTFALGGFTITGSRYQVGNGGGIAGTGGSSTFFPGSTSGANNGGFYA